MSISLGSTRLIWPGPSLSLVPKQTSMVIGFIPHQPTGRQGSSAIKLSPSMVTTPKLSRASAPDPFQGPRVGQDIGVHHQSVRAAVQDHLRPPQKPPGGGRFFLFSPTTTTHVNGSLCVRKTTRKLK